jgi:hypothetical protein
VGEEEKETGAGGAGAAGESSARRMAADRLRRVAEAEGLDVARVLALDDAEPGELVELPDEVLACYARALIETAEREAGRVPEGWSVAAVCAGCGPVWLGAGSPERVVSCPWCWNRKAGRVLPGRSDTRVVRPQSLASQWLGTNLNRRPNR